MGPNDLNVALVLRLVNRVTRPARAVMDTLRQVDAQVVAAGRRGVAWSNAQIEAIDARRGALQGEALGIAATGFALAQALRPAIELETAMAGVNKVLDFDAPDGLTKMQRDILALTTEKRLPMLAEDIAAIVEAAGQAGVVDSALPDDAERRQLLEFAEAAAQMGVAFDMGAAQAGQVMADLRARLRLSQPEVMGLSDAANHLSNNMNATASEIVNVIGRQGAVAKTAGLANMEIAALSAAFVAAAPSQEIAATALKNFLDPLGAGEALTKRQSDALQRLGIDGLEMARRMQTDARGGIMAVMEALAELPEFERNSVLSQLFGEESKGAIAPLLTNLDLLRRSFDLVAEPADFAGSMLEEYEAQAATTANQLRVTSGFIRGMAVAVGTVLLPELNALLASMQPVIAQVTAWAQANPELVSTIAKVAAGLFAFRLASVGVRFALLTVASPLLRVFRAFSLLASLRPIRWARLITPLRWAAFIPAIAWRALASPLLWASLIMPLRWSARLLPKIAWGAAAGLLNWRMLIAPLKWTARLIPVIGWALLAGQFAWSVLGLKNLPWADYIKAIGWSELDIMNFRWRDVLPEFRWDEIIPPFNGFQTGPGTGPRGNRNGGARDTGGAVSPFTLYPINERGEEAFVPHVAGTVMPLRDVTRLGREVDRMRGRARQMVSGTGASRGRSGGASAARSVTINVGGITVAPPAGADPRAAAREVERVLIRMEREAEMALDDGAIA